MSPQIISLAFSLCFCLVVSSADGEASGLCLSPGVDKLLENLTRHYSQGVTISLETSSLSSALNCSLHQLDCGQSCQCLDLGRLCEDADCGTADPEVLTVEQYERTSVVLLYHLFHLSEACSNHSDSSRMMLTSYDEYHYWFMPNGTNITDTLHLMFHNLVELTEDHDDHHEDHEDHDDNDDHDDHDEDEDHDDHDHDDHDDHDEDEDHDHEDHDEDHGDDHHDDMCIDDDTFDHLFEDVEIDNVTVEYISGRTVLLIFQGYRFAHICDEHDVTPEAIYENLLFLLGIDNEFDRESLCELMGRLGIGGDECTMDDHDHDSHEDDHDSHEDHDEDDDDDHDDHDDHDHRKRREAGHLIQKRQADMAAIECLTVDDILSIYQITSPGITQSDFERLCPALLEQHLSDVCAVEEVDKKEGPTKAERYGYGTLAVAFITLCAIFGILLVLCNNHSGIKDSIMACLIALAVGTLSTDAILHLIPAAFGLHSHGASGEDDGHNHGDEGIKLSDYAQKGLLILAAFYALYLLEVLMSKLGHSRSRIHDGHSDTEASEIDQDSFNRTKIDNHAVSSNAIEMSEKTSGDQTSCLAFRSIKPVAWMVLFGDGVHNFADGLAIGGAFSVSITSGVSTSLAILCHELPHELGDFAILLNSGFKPLAALFLNVLSALTAFIGLYVGLSLASDESARQWIFTLAAGMFLYIALADMIPELLCMLQKGPFWRIFIFQNIGLLLGCLILVLLNLYEEHIQV